MNKIRREKGEPYYEETVIEEYGNITLMAIAAKSLYRRSLAEAERLMTTEQPQEKGGRIMAREAAARGSMRDAIKRRQQEQSHGGGGFSINLPDGVKFYKPDGKTIEFDFIPYVISDPRNIDVVDGRRQVGDLSDGRFYWVHNEIGTEQKPYICLKTFKQRCPICEAQQEMAKNPKADADAVKALKSKERVLYNVIDVNDKSGTIMVWDVSYHLFTKQLEKEQNECEDYYDYADPDNGYSVRIRFAENSFQRNKFFEADRLDFSKRKPLSDADLKAAVDLDACLQHHSYEKLQAIFLGTEDEGAQPDEKEPAGRGRGGREQEPAGRGSRDEAPPAGRRGDPAPAAGRGRGGRDDTIHDKDPDRQRDRNGGEIPDDMQYKGELDEKGKCPGGGKFGADEGQLDFCNKDCPEDTWRECRDEKDRQARAAKEADKGAKGRGRGSEEPPARGRQR